jgi:hypothetical protein
MGGETKRVRGREEGDAMGCVGGGVALMGFK